MLNFFKKVVAAVKNAAANRIVRNVCVLLLISCAVVLVPFVFANLSNPMYVGLLLVTVCLVIDMIPDAFVTDDTRTKTWEIVTVIKRAISNRAVRNICIILLFVHCVLLTPLVLLKWFDLVPTGLLLVSMCVILDMIPDAFVQEGGNDETKERPDSD